MFPRGASIARRFLPRHPFIPVPFFARGIATSTPPAILSAPLDTADPELYSLIHREALRQRDSICLIPSENFTSRAVAAALASPLQNKYSEGYPGARYYGGNEIIDCVERLCQRRALDAFDLDPAKWGVNVQALSGAPANLYVYGALLQPHDRIMGLDLPSGGHLSHGYATPLKAISHVSQYYTTMPYKVDSSTGLIDYERLQELVLAFRPKLIVAGASAYPRHIDYAVFREVADSVNAHLVVDMAHISGMVATRHLPSPFEFADVVTTTTHKSLRGPRGAMIFFRRGQRGLKAGKPVMYDLEDRINFSVFPGHQGGPHNHTIGALAVALKLAKEPAYHEYQRQVLDNAQALAKALQSRGYNLISGGTDTHLMLIDLQQQEIDGARVERVLELCRVAANKNTIPSDVSALVPYGLRVGTPAMTTRGLRESDWEDVAEFIHRGVRLARELDAGVTGRRVRDFRTAIASFRVDERLVSLREDVVAFARQWPVVGYSEHVVGSLGLDEEASAEENVESEQL